MRGATRMCAATRSLSTFALEPKNIQQHSLVISKEEFAGVVEAFGVQRHQRTVLSLGVDKKSLAIAILCQEYFGPSNLKVVAHSYLWSKVGDVCKREEGYFQTLLEQLGLDLQWTKMTTLSSVSEPREAKNKFVEKMAVIATATDFKAHLIIQPWTSEGFMAEFLRRLHRLDLDVSTRPIFQTTKAENDIRLSYLHLHQFSKARLEATCEAHGFSMSNGQQNISFKESLVKKQVTVLNCLPTESLQSLQTLMSHYHIYAQTVRQRAWDLLGKCRVYSTLRYAVIHDAPSWTRDQVAARASLRIIIELIAGLAVFNLKTAFQNLTKPINQSTAIFVVGDCLFIPHATTNSWLITLVKHKVHAALEIRPGSTVAWHGFRVHRANRPEPPRNDFGITVYGTQDRLFIGPLTDVPWHQLPKHVQQIVAPLPIRVQQTLPILYTQNRSGFEFCYACFMDDPKPLFIQSIHKPDIKRICEHYWGSDIVSTPQKS